MPLRHLQLPYALQMAEWHKEVAKNSTSDRGRGGRVSGRGELESESARGALANLKPRSALCTVSLLERNGPDSSRKGINEDRYMGKQGV